jgi:nitrate reductase NapE component
MSIPTTPGEQPKSRNWLTIVVAVVVLCCLCGLSVTLVGGYRYGDDILRILGLTARLAAGMM